ncbi:hypothetical protein SCAR479_03839 [Seiridium cardinale]|uniref:Uncharacterized protein n=1 Tax=Seiridium cardinale TaxID=138064 RepID=A0ABR2XZX9_9PEZI
MPVSASIPARHTWPWGCFVPIDARAIPTSRQIAHCHGCQCPGPSEDVVLSYIQHHYLWLHNINRVAFSVEVVNELAKQNARAIGITMTKGIHELPEFKAASRYQVNQGGLEMHERVALMVRETDGLDYASFESR